MGCLRFVRVQGNAWRNCRDIKTMPRPKIAFVASEVPLAQKALAELSALHGNVPQRRSTE